VGDTKTNEQNPHYHSDKIHHKTHTHTHTHKINIIVNAFWTIMDFDDINMLWRGWYYFALVKCLFESFSASLEFEKDTKPQV